MVGSWQVDWGFIARIVLTIFYFTIFMPFGIGVRLFSDPLDIKNLRPVWLKPLDSAHRSEHGESHH